MEEFIDHCNHMCVWNHTMLEFYDFDNKNRRKVERQGKEDINYITYLLCLFCMLWNELHI